MQDDEPQLSAEQLRNAAIKALQNASELVDEAQLLFEHGHWSRAVFLCFISGEELGKCFISLSAVVNRMAGRFNEQRYKERFRSHREKTGSLTHFENFFVFLEDPPIERSELSAITQQTETVKLSALYCDFYGVHAHTPSELIPQELASNALLLAKDRVQHFVERVRPKLDLVLQLDPAEIRRFQRDFLQAMGADVEFHTDP